MRTLYVLDFDKGVVKIGITENLPNRVANIKTGGGYVYEPRIFKIDNLDNAFDVEQAVLTFFKDKVVNGEWLACSFEEVCEKVNTVVTRMSEGESVTSDFHSILKSFVSHTQVNLTRLAKVVNDIKQTKGEPVYQLSAFLNSKMLREYLVAASNEWCLLEDEILIRGKKGNGATLCHVSIAVLFVEMADIKLKAKIHKALISNWLSEHYAQGGTEFKNLNAAMSLHLGQDTDGFQEIAKLVRSRILGDDSSTDDWNNATVNQTHLRYEWENKLCDMLRLGVVRDYPHLKELVEKL